MKNENENKNKKNKNNMNKKKPTNYFKGNGDADLKFWRKHRA